MSGDVIDNNVSVIDAQLLAYQVQYFYRDQNFHMVRTFNADPNNFDFKDVLREIENELVLKAGNARKK